MPSTHFSLYFHIVFSTKERRPTISDSWKDRLHSYIGGIVRTMGGVAEAIGGTANHIHILVSLRVTTPIPDLVRDIKHLSSKWVHNEVGKGDFFWQKGYGIFTVAPTQTEIVKSYIANQQKHHQNKGFEQEYMEFLRRSRAEYDERYLW